MPCTYVKNVEKLPALFEAIRVTGVPNKFTYRFLARMGFSSSADRSLLDLLKDLGLIDSQGLTTDLYVAVRDSSRFEEILHNIIENQYSDVLVENSPYDIENVSKFYRVVSGFSEKRATNCAEILKTLADLSHYPNPSVQQLKSDDVTKNPTPFKTKTTTSAKNVNININIPSDMSDELFEKFINSLKDLLS